ncbi:pre-rRNA processing protein [Aspergillus nanangensis]|uniref:Pre-rRNA processing protein n=1 Tax=Aspergillus nanangensis TaxID=2582783 RepID=A0AAD4CCY7_ASPNN|nr:pre-rRNA processing protein [Aspergillus nanangensis]
MSSFFTQPASQRKRKRDDRVGAPASKKRGVHADGDSNTKGSRRPREREESISGSDLDEDELSAVSGLEEEESGSESDDGETAADRRLKLAERYLENVRDEVDDYGFDAAEIDRDLIAERLKEDVDEFKGRVYRQIASDLSFSTASHSFFRADTQSTTSIAVHEPYVYTVSKDKTLIKWELATPGPATAKSAADSQNGSSKRTPRPQRRKPKQVRFARGLQKVAESEEEQGHTKNILSVAVSPSGKFIATGGEDNKLIIWDAETLKPMQTFTHHRDSVSGLAFARHLSSMSSGEQLFSGSFDRTIKTWSLSSAGHAYVETLFGHQDNVASLTALKLDECISVGARDRTARLWKVIDESQLIFRGGSSKNAAYRENNLDCVAPLPPTHFVTGSDSGSISLWAIHKKKPLFTVPLAHGLDPLPPLDELSSELDPNTATSNTRHIRRMPRWITALATVPGTDIVLSGSWDGFVRAWKISEDKKSIKPLGPVGAGSQLQTAPDTPSAQLKQSLAFDTPVNSDHMVVDGAPDHIKDEGEPLVKGVINHIAVFERRADTVKPGQSLSESKSKSKTPESEARGLCIVAAVGKEHRLARWKCFSNNFYEGATSEGRNGAVVFEVPFTSDQQSTPKA